MTARELYDIVSAPHWATCWPKGLYTVVTEDGSDHHFVMALERIAPAYAALMFEAGAIRTLMERHGGIELNLLDDGTVFLWLPEAKRQEGPTLLHALDAALKVVTA